MGAAAPNKSKIILKKDFSYLQNNISKTVGETDSLMDKSGGFGVQNGFTLFNPDSFEYTSSIRVHENYIRCLQCL